MCKQINNFSVSHEFAKKNVSILCLCVDRSIINCSIDLFFPIKKKMFKNYFAAFNFYDLKESLFKN